MISHDHRCIFTHIPKTGGKSLKQLFQLPEFERDYKADGRNIEHAYGHRPLLDYADRDCFAAYFKFAFVRNPFDRLVSAYFYLHKGGCNEVDRRFRDEHLGPYGGHFAAFVEDLPKFLGSTHFKPQVFWVCDGRGRLLADRVYRYEAFDRDAALLARRFALARDTPAVVNACAHRPYRSCYDEATKRRVALAYGEDLELFSYGFE